MRTTLVARTGEPTAPVATRGRQLAMAYRFVLVASLFSSFLLPSSGPVLEGVRLLLRAIGLVPFWMAVWEWLSEPAAK